jgi:SAM-dependent methyltransferase
MAAKQQNAKKALARVKAVEQIQGMLPQHQISHFTRTSRNPEAITFVRDKLKKVKAPKVLSFGCSKGRECQDIIDLWPSATVIGVDRWPNILDKARELHPDPRIRFLVATKENMEENGPYDAIFAMNVLCKHPETIGLDNIADVYPFDAFNEAVVLLAGLLKPGGILTVFNTPYFVEDSDVGEQFEPFRSTDEVGTSAKCDKDGKRVTDTVVKYKGKEYTRDQWREYIRSTPQSERPEKGDPTVGYRLTWTDAKDDDGRSLRSISFRKSVTN